MNNQQKSVDKFWKDESGATIPYSRTTPLERNKEKTAASILKKASSVSLALEELKHYVREKCQEIYDQHMDEAGISEDRRSKGNFTWYNFDRSIKISVKINERIDFDDLTIQSAKAKLDEFLDRSITSNDDATKQLVTDAFETRGGKLDTKKVLGLLRYKTKIKDATFLEAMALIEAAIRRPDSKTYFSVAVREDDNSYTNINLDFASI
jgi:hypothetical protein